MQVAIRFQRRKSDIQDRIGPSIEAILALEAGEESGFQTGEGFTSMLQCPREGPGENGGHEDVEFLSGFVLQRFNGV